MNLLLLLLLQVFLFCILSNLTEIPSSSSSFFYTKCHLFLCYFVLSTHFFFSFSFPSHVHFLLTTLLPLDCAYRTRTTYTVLFTFFMPLHTYTPIIHLKAHLEFVPSFVSLLSSSSIFADVSFRLTFLVSIPVLAFFTFRSISNFNLIAFFTLLLPFLAIKCPEPVIPSNGRVIKDSDRFEFGDSIEYQCNSGFILQGESVSICMQNGSWSLSVPQCK